MWLDLEGPSEEELVQLGEEFDLHPLAIEDVFLEHQRPKAVEYDDFFFVVFNSVSFDAKTGLDACELDMFLGQNYLITVHTGHVLELDEVEQRWRLDVRQLAWGIGV